MKNTKTLKLAQLALLVAIVLIMAYTPLGYLRTVGLEISFLMIPVTIGAIVIGPMGGAILGLIFGLTSFGTCFGTSVFGAALLNINPVGTFITCVVARTLAGFLAGVIFKALKKTKAGVPVTSLAGPVLNTVFFMGCIVLFFYGTDYIQNYVTVLGAANPFMFIVLFVGLQGAVEAVVCCLISGIVSKSILKYTDK